MSTIWFSLNPWKLLLPARQRQWLAGLRIPKPGKFSESLCTISEIDCLNASRSACRNDKSILPDTSEGCFWEIPIPLF